MKALDNIELEQQKAEAKEKWGETAAYREYAEKTKSYTKQTHEDMAAGLDHIMAEFAAAKSRGETPDSSEVQGLVKNLQNYITENYYLCTAEILAGLSQMYVADERFRTHIDRHGAGTAEFIREAVTLYVHLL